MADPTQWVGVPFEYGGRGPDKFDCYGLIKAIHAEQGIEIPDYISPTDNAAIAGIFATQLPAWREVPRGPDTVVVLRIGNLYSHCGYMLDHNRMIHAWRTAGGVSIQRIDAWEHRILGFYRYAGHENN